MARRMITVRAHKRVAPRPKRPPSALASMPVTAGPPPISGAGGVAVAAPPMPAPMPAGAPLRALSGMDDSAAGRRR